MFFAVVGLLIIGLGWWLHLRIQAKGKKAQAWPTTAGTVTGSAVMTIPVMGSPMLTPAVTYSYQVGGQAMESAALRLGEPPAFNKPAKAEALAARYPVGSQVTVHYDPAAPEMAALDLKVGEGYVPLMVYSFGGTLLALGIFSAVMGV